MFTIRSASRADVEALLPLKAALHERHVIERPDIFKAMSERALSEWLRDRLADDATDVWIAEEEGEPVGYLMAARRERGETSYSLARRWCEIDEVAVEASHRRGGVARALIERAAAEARASGMPSVELTTWSFNEPAQRAFMAVGFEPMILRYELREAGGPSRRTTPAAGGGAS